MFLTLNFHNDLKTPSTLDASLELTRPALAVTGGLVALRAVVRTRSSALSALTLRVSVASKRRATSSSAKFVVCNVPENTVVAVEPDAGFVGDSVVHHARIAGVGGRLTVSSNGGVSSSNSGSGGGSSSSSSVVDNTRLVLAAHTVATLPLTLRAAAGVAFERTVRVAWSVRKSSGELFRRRVELTLRVAPPFQASATCVPLVDASLLQVTIFLLISLALLYDLL